MRKGIGDILDEGIYRAAIKIGEMKNVDVTNYSIQSKGVAIGADGIRSGSDCGSDLLFMLGSRSGPYIHRRIADRSKAVTGWDITREEWHNSIALKTVQIQRAALLLGRPDLTWDQRTDDENPQRSYEPLPAGPKAGEKTDKDKFSRRRKEFYAAMG